MYSLRVVSIRASLNGNPRKRPRKLLMCNPGFGHNCGHRADKWGERPCLRLDHAGFGRNGLLSRHTNPIRALKKNRRSLRELQCGVVEREQTGPGNPESFVSHRAVESRRESGGGLCSGCIPKRQFRKLSLSIEPSHNSAGGAFLFRRFSHFRIPAVRYPRPAQEEQ